MTAKIDSIIPNLPVGWANIEFGKGITIIDYRGRTPPYSFHGIPHIRSSNIRNGKVLLNGLKYISNEAYDKYMTRGFPKKGDLLFTTEAPMGEIALIPDFLFSVAQRLLILSPVENCLDSKFLLYQIMSADFQSKIRIKGTGTTVTGVSSRNLKPVQILIAPIFEQRRIARKIEELFSFLDAGTASLHKVQTELKRYRQAVLKYAFEGKLTEEWRKKNRNHSEPILKSLEPAPINQNARAPLDYSELPENWIWAQFDAVCNKIQDGTHFSPKTQYDKPGENTYLYITAKNIKESGIDLSNVTYVDFLTHKSISKRCNPEINDVLLIKDGVKTGVATVNTLEEAFSLLSSVALFKPKENLLNPYFLKHFLNSPTGFKLTTGKMTGTAIKRIILDKIRKSCLPLAPLSEQIKIVEEIEFRLSIADAIASVAKKSLNQSVTLRNSILQSAFRGKLVVQDPSDEPAELWLYRIKNQKKDLSKNTTRGLMNYVK